MHEVVSLLITVVQYKVLCFRDHFSACSLLCFKWLFTLRICCRLLEDDAIKQARELEICFSCDFLKSKLGPKFVEILNETKELQLFFSCSDWPVTWLWVWQCRHQSNRSEGALNTEILRIQTDILRQQIMLLQFCIRVWKKETYRPEAFH